MILMTWRDGAACLGVDPSCSSPSGTPVLRFARSKRQRPSATGVRSLRTVWAGPWIPDRKRASGVGSQQGNDVPSDTGMPVPVVPTQ